MNFKEFLNEAYKIHKNDQVRKNVADIKTYWDKPGQALTALQEILRDQGFQIEGTPSFNVHDKTPEYTQRFNIEKIEDPNTSLQTNSILVFSWHWMGSGNQVEITAYLS